MWYFETVDRWWQFKFESRGDYPPSPHWKVCGCSFLLMPARICKRVMACDDTKYHSHPDAWAVEYSSDHGIEFTFIRFWQPTRLSTTSAPIVGWCSAEVLRCSCRGCVWSHHEDKQSSRIQLKRKKWVPRLLRYPRCQQSEASSSGPGDTCTATSEHL